MTIACYYTTKKHRSQYDPVRHDRHVGNAGLFSVMQNVKGAQLPTSFS